MKSMRLGRNKKLVRAAKQVCRELRRRSTPAEQAIWEEVRDRRFLGLKFYRQHPLFVTIGGRETFFVADFYCHERKLAVEIDGKIHDYQQEYDKARTAAINSLGIEVIRVKNEEIERDVKRVLEKLREAMRQG